MVALERRLRRQGFAVHNVSYPSRPRTFKQAMEAVECRLEGEGLDRADRLSWVTYSLGGLLARAYVAEHDRRGDRMVMLAPPNRGSEIVDAIGHWRLFRLAFGELASELGTRDDSLPRRLEVPNAEVGVIAGDRWISPLGPLLLRADNDGSVTVDSTRLPGMRDHLVVPHSHTFLMNAPRVARQTAHFLRHGSFERAV